MLIKRSVGEEQFVYITDDSDIARKMIQSGLAVVGISYPGSERQDWSGISYILELDKEEELDALEDWYVKEVWCRTQKEPVVIGTFFIEPLKLQFCIREMKVEDLEQLYTIYEEETIRLWITPLNSDIDVEKEKIKAYIQNVYEIYGCGMWILEVVETGEIIGRVGIEPCEGEEGLFLGYMIAKKWRGNHIAENACKISLEYVKNRLEPDGIWCKIAEGNFASRKLAQKLGFILCKKRDDIFYYFLG